MSKVTQAAQNLHLIYVEPSPKHHNNRIFICIDYPLLEKGEVGASEATLGTQEHEQENEGEAHETECEASETKCEHQDNDCENQGCGQTKNSSLDECGQAKFSPFRV